MKADYIDKLRAEYINNHTRIQEREELIRENRIEKRDITGYHGREIFELIQNADDAFQKSIEEGHNPDCGLQVSISFKNNILTVSNSGTFFDEQGIKAIVEGNNSPKSGKYLGNKGTGFRSVLNWATNIKIFSGEFAVEFSDSVAKEISDSIRHEPQIIKQLEKEPDLYIPMLSVPRTISHDRPQELTTIEIVTDPHKLNDDFSVTRQLSNLDFRILLFLPNVSSIKIDTESGNILLERIKEHCVDHGKIKETLVTIRKSNNGDKCVEERYRLFKKNIPDLIKAGNNGKEVSLAIAIPYDKTSIIQCVYSYFPLLDTNSPFNCILHATYELGDHRNTINKTENNKIVVKEQLDFIIEVSEILITGRQFQQAYNLIRPVNLKILGDHVCNWKFLSAFSLFELEGYYIDKLQNLKIFQTVCNRLISISEKPKLLNVKFPKSFRNKAFKNLLKFSDDKNRADILTLIKSHSGIDIEYTPSELCEAINAIVAHLDIHERVKVFLWWNRWTSQNRVNILPKLLKDSRSSRNSQEEDSGEWVKQDAMYYLLEGDFDSVRLPRWVKIPSLNLLYQNILVEETKKEYHIKVKKEDGRSVSVIRQICNEQIFHCVKFKYRDRSNIIPAINSSVEGRYKRAVEFIKWLWKNYRGSDDLSGKTVFESLNFPATTQTVLNSHKLYFSVCYGNSLADTLFSGMYGYRAFPGPAEFSIRLEEKEEFMQFIRRFGVLDFPPIIKAKIKPIQKYDQLIRAQIIRSGALTAFNSQNIQKVEYELRTIIGIEEKLQNLTTSDIVRWILKDPALNVYLNPANKTTSDFHIRYQGYSQHRERDYKGVIPDYIYFCINNIPWIILNGNRYAPCQILNGFIHKRNLKFCDNLPVLSDKDIERIAAEVGISFGTTVELFLSLDLAKNVTDLTSQDFYGLLLQLSENADTANYDKFRSIYRLIEQADFTKYFEDSANKKRFMSGGKLLVRYMGESKLWAANESYLPSSRIVDRKKYPIVDKSLRTNNDNFIRIFGCKSYNRDYTIVEGSQQLSALNAEFNKYFDSFIVYARAYAERNDNIARNIEKLSIVLVDSIVIREEGREITIKEPYTLVREDANKWYIIDNNSEININELSEIIESIFENIANTPKFEIGKIGELFRSSDETRKFLIEKDFGTLSVIDEWDCDTRIRKCFEKTLWVFGYGKDELEKYDINFKNFNSIENIPGIIAILKSIDIDVGQFIEAGFVYGIDLKKYWSIKLSEFIRNEQEKFINVKYKEALHDRNLQKNFISTINRFKYFADSVEPENSIEYDPVETVISEFGEWRNEKFSQSAADIYNRNYEAMNPESLFSDEIAKDIQAQTMIYFNLESEFKSWIKRRKDIDAKESGHYEPDPYSRFRKILPTEHKRLTGGDKKSKNYGGQKSDDPKKRLYHGAFSRKDAQKKNDRLSKIGNIGELLIYNALCAKYGKENVFPISEAFVDLGILKPGQAHSRECDLSYMNENGDKIMVEVKTGTRGIFYMSPEELSFAERIYNESETSSTKYKLVYVYDIDRDEPKYEFLPDGFWMNPEYHRKDIVEKIEFSI